MIDSINTNTVKLGTLAAAFAAATLQVLVDSGLGISQTSWAIYYPVLTAVWAWPVRYIVYKVQTRNDVGGA